MTDCARLLYAGGIFMKVSYRAGQTVQDFSRQVGIGMKFSHAGAGKTVPDFSMQVGL